MAADDPIVAGMAGRYATALFELARDSGTLDAVSRDLDSFEALLHGSPDLLRLVRSPAFSAEEQTRAVTAVLAKAKMEGTAANFLRLVASNRRLFAVRDMIRDFRELLARHRGEVTALVTVAEPLADAHKAEIKKALDAVTGKNVKVEVQVDPAIIGGLVVKVGSRMVDGSLRTKLNAIKHAMKEVG
ncbi:F0F1 ATP synthase subunit delta [Rhodoplanes sp. TEM]|uniref:ATP synthase subunit delta n=1 Tax=Rhodoplanes tepidamans TaxID=200616 RepID=A0ABT5J3B0_RHOTP|nr:MULTISPECIES: F0F1 ATP synthase subunit delta [Rhodoplanes]MDC7784150.1 F0F1 ATP synthase subunit delta [Rhodoplanes tepidamans]MDC7983245.1 F0F1 ATP synthase subunit delta [Rhodoplanes sp. TEM]MDQ0356752.1 F-type H+-transporting ATPase subunit delta [Rhodoplanes tepidamans]